MTTRIFNKNDYEQPADGWYMLEPKGEHPNRRSGVLQVIDDKAIQSIVNSFNREAAAGKLSHGNSMLVDHEHFRHDPDKETRAFGWLQELLGRADGYYGRIRWTGTGQAAVDNGDYRFFSTEYDPEDLVILDGGGNLKRVRPLRLDGLTLTNAPNNKGGRPITNRRVEPGHGQVLANLTNRGNSQELAAKRFAELALDEQRRTGCSLASAWLRVQNREGSLCMMAGGPRPAGDSQAREAELASSFLLSLANEERRGGPLSLALGPVMNRNATLARAAGYIFPKHRGS